MKIAIIGTGRVGSTAAYCLVLKQLCDHLVIANRTYEKALGDALDLQHTLAFCERPMHIEARPMDAVENCDVLLVAASIPSEGPMVSRLQLGARNAAMFRELIPPLARRNPNALFIIITNPVDVMTYLATKLSGFPSRRVLGIGTLVDSARFRSMLSQEEHIHPNDLRAYILGEHGANQFPAFTSAQAGGEHIDDTPSHRKIFQQVSDAGFEIYHHKGFTNYAIATAACLVVKAIVYDEHCTVPIATCFEEWHDVRDNCFSIPVVLGRNGVIRHLHPQLNALEKSELLAAAHAVKQSIRDILPDLAGAEPALA